MTLVFTRPAEQEAADARDWYESQRIGLGLKFLESLSRLLKHIESAPQSFSRAADYVGHREIRRGLIRRFPYRVLFEISSNELVVILAVAHSRRRPGYWQDRLK